jgi:hypothetical protein
MAIGLIGIVLGCRRREGSSQKFPTIEGAQETSSAPSLAEKLNSRRYCSPSQRRVMSIPAASASMFNNRRDISEEREFTQIPTRD